MARIFKTPFGAQGDTEQVPEAPQGDGSVSLTQGFGYDYEREYEDPAAKDIRREVMNGLFHDITEAIGDIQLSGVAKWDASAAPYPAGAVVWHNNAAWMSTAGNNSSVPGAGIWKAVDLSSSIRLSESIDQVPDAETVQQALAGLGESVRSATETVRGTLRLASAEQAQALTADDVAITPETLSDAMNAHVLGMGQTWQDVASSRHGQTNYTNTTGRTIAVYINFRNGGDSIFDAILVDGVSVGFVSGIAGVSNFFIVPPGSVYRANTSVEFSIWAELR